jgi:hypothetical protein
VAQAIPPNSSQSADSSNLSSRIFFIDLLKAISISAVVFYHGVFFPIATYFSVAIPELVLSSALRFCVPILLTISFFLFERELSKPNRSSWATCRKRLVRIAIPTGFWFSLSGLIQMLRGNSLPELLQEALTGNIYIGAYFLLILLQLTPIYILIRGWFKQTRNILTVIGLQAVVFISIKVFTFQTDIFGKAAITALANIDRPFLIYWFVYMAIGYFLYHYLASVTKLSSSLPGKLKILLIFITSIWMTWEYATLIPNIGSHFYVFEYAFLACIASVFIAFISTASIQENQVPPILAALIFTLSKYSLGIFCVNGILSQGFSLLAHHLFNGITFNLVEVFTARLVGFLILMVTSLVTSICLAKLGLKACVV